LDVTVYVFVQLKMNDRAAYDRYQARFFEGPRSMNPFLTASTLC
jgi:hypothetical protein